MDIDPQLAPLKKFSKIADPSWWKLLHRVIPEEVIEQVLDQTGARETRQRKLTAKTMLLFVIAMGLFTEECSEQVFCSMLEGIRFQHPELDGRLPKKGGSVRRVTASGRNRWSSCSAAFADPSQRPIRRERSSSGCV